MHGLGPVLSLFTVASTLIGGLVAIRLKHRLGGAMAFTGGVVLGVSLLDITPEAIDNIGVGGGRTFGLAVGLGFLGFFLLSRAAVLHHRDDPELAAGHARVGALGAGILSFHSFLDGFGIGAAFAFSPTVGVAILIAVVSHDFADGMNTVTFVLSQDGTVGRARGWLVTDALAPVAGAIAGSFVQVEAHPFGIGLAVFAGIFLAIGTGELLPAAHSEPSMARIGLTLAGFALMLIVTTLSSL